MGRSVSYLSNYTQITYIAGDTDSYEDMDGMWFDDLLGNITSGLMAKFPSLYKAKRWEDNETKIILENELAEIAIAEYCGLVSLSARPKIEGLGDQWLSQVWPNVEKELAGFSQLLNRMGTFSNGEAIFSSKQV